MKRKLQYITVTAFLLLLGIGLIYGSPAFATHENGVPHIIPENKPGDLNNCVDQGNFPIQGFFDLANSIVKLILGVSGALALLMFVYGGILWVISAGEDKRVTEGKDVMKNAVIGLVIVFGSWTLVNVVISTLTTDPKNFHNIAAIETPLLDANNNPVIINGKIQMTRDISKGSQASIYLEDKWGTWSGWTYSVNTPGTKCLTLGDLCANCRNGRPGAKDSYCEGSGNMMGCKPKKASGIECGNNFECKSDYCKKEAGASRGMCAPSTIAVTPVINSNCGANWPDMHLCKEECECMNSCTQVDVDANGNPVKKCMLPNNNTRGLCCAIITRTKAGEILGNIGAFEYYVKALKNTNPTGCVAADTPQEFQIAEGSLIHKKRFCTKTCGEKKVMEDWLKPDWKTWTPNDADWADVPRGCEDPGVPQTREIK